MAKKEKVTGPVTATNATTVAKIGNVLSAAYRDKELAGGAIGKTMCDALIPLIPEGGLKQVDIDAIGRKVAEDRNWQPDTAKSRKTEIKAVLTAPKKLSTAIKGFTDKTGFCGWPNVVALARTLAKGGTADEAVATLTAEKVEKTIDTKEKAQKWVAMKLKSIVKADCLEFMPKNFKKELIGFAVAHALNVGSTA